MNDWRRGLGCFLGFALLVGMTGAVHETGEAGAGGAALDEVVPVCVVQGDGLVSPRLGQRVSSAGLVTLDLDETSRRGFFLQETDCDGDPATSDGVYVYLGERLDVVRTGDRVEVGGTVDEYYGLTEIAAAPGDVRVVSSGNPLPAGVELNPPFDEGASRAYFESLEGMVVKLDQALVVGPTDADDRSWLARADLGIKRVFRDDPAGTGEVICVDDGGLFDIRPEVKVGEGVDELAGVLDFRVGVYCLQLLSEPEVRLEPKVRPDPQVWPVSGILAVDTAGVKIQSPLPGEIRLATINLASLFDTQDDPLRDDSVLSGAEYQRRLRKRALAIHEYLGEPDLLAVQEAENKGVLVDLTAMEEIQAAYGMVFLAARTAAAWILPCCIRSTGCVSWASR